ncbi:DegV family protein [Alkalicoccus urumqiensis]|uniref:DegV family protein n=1 Tax=Alkalicoccus urumqiensis TaxID=1548213 RepID=A0A2P6MJ60_ALKUR|nr:DegV family protein [Alkalicoccus urumqiensis]PRO66293.1 DegV family protein [Alkalicoccus urumqiensis]
MTKVAWVTDSTAYLPEDLIKHPDVYVLPLGITFGTEVLEDGIDITTTQLYTRLKESKEVPKTSQPPAGAFASLYEELKKNYDSAIAVHISGNLSGTLESSRQGADIAAFPVRFIDSRSMSYAMTTLIYQGMQLLETGAELDEVEQKLNENAARSESYILLGSLEQFYKGGRMSGAQYLIGNLLKIKPIITIDSAGTFQLFQKVRSEKKALRRMMDLLAEAYEDGRMKSMQVLHGNIPQKAAEVKQMIHERYPDLHVTMGEISSTIAVHAGEGTLAFLWQNKSGSKSTG